MVEPVTNQAKAIELGRHVLSIYRASLQLDPVGKNRARVLETRGARVQVREHHPYRSLQALLQVARDDHRRTTTARAKVDHALIARAPHGFGEPFGERQVWNRRPATHVA